MCNTHYMAWRRANPEHPTVTENSNQAVLDVLPGTLREISAKSGLHHETVSRVLKRMNVWKDRQVHIYDYRPPQAPGEAWRPLWKAGSTANYKLPEERRRAHAKKVKDSTRPINKVRAAAGMIAPPPRASWFGPLEAIA